MLLANRDRVHVDTIHKPAALAIAVRSNQQVIATHHALAHLARVASKGPVLQSVAPLPLHPVLGILELVPELHGDAIVVEGKKLLAQTVVTLALPLGCEESNDGLGAGEERSAITPDAGRSIALSDSWRVPLITLVRLAIAKERTSTGLEECKGWST